MSKLYKILVLGLLLFPISGKAKLFKAEEFALDNGLRVVVIENHKAPLIKQMVWYLAGSADEKRGKGGSAHLLEHLMFRGTQKLEDGRFNQIMDENGADGNAFTSYDVTAYHQFADVSRLEVLMALEADRMQNLNFSDEAFKAEQKIVFQERKQVVENNPAAPFAERLNLLLWGNLPYGHPVTGLVDEIMNLSADDVRDFYHRYYAPNNAILVLAGDIDVSTAKILAEKYYGKIPAREITKTPKDTISGYFRDKIVMKLPQITVPKQVYKYVLPNKDGLSADLYAYVLLAEYLGGGHNSVLYKELVTNAGLLTSVSASFDYFYNSNSIFSIAVQPSNDKSLIEVDVAVRLTATQAVKDLSAEKLEKLKKRLLAGLVFSNDNPEDAAYWLGSMLAYGFSLEEAQSFAENIQAVTLDDMFAAAKEVLLKSPSIEGVLLPENKKGEIEGD